MFHFSAHITSCRLDLSCRSDCQDLNPTIFCSSYQSSRNTAFPGKFSNVVICLKTKLLSIHPLKSIWKLFGLVCYRIRLNFCITNFCHKSLVLLLIYKITQIVQVYALIADLNLNCLLISTFEVSCARAPPTELGGGGQISSPSLYIKLMRLICSYK